MRNEFILLCLVVILIGNIGIVSAESNVLNFEHRTSNIAITETQTGTGSFGFPGAVTFSNIANYPSVSKIVISDDRSNKMSYGGTYGSHPEITQLETSFTLRTNEHSSGVIVARGTYETYRFISDGVSTGTTEILYFDEWDIGSLSGNKWLYFSFDDPAQIVAHSCIATGGGVSSSPIEGSVCFRSTRGYGFGQTVRVYNEYNFHQDLYYNYDDDLGQMDITLQRNNVWSNLTLLYNTTNEVISISRSADDFNRLHFLDGQAVKVILTNSLGTEWTNVIPSGIAYKPIPPSVIGSTIGKIGLLDLNLTGYRDKIEEIPFLGNLSIPYLNFVDGVSNDVNGHIYDVVSVLMSPLYILNEKVAIISNLLADQIKDLISGLDIITAPIQSVINAIPGKVMGFFVFFLLLDIIRVIIGWGM